MLEWLQALLDTFHICQLFRDEMLAGSDNLEILHALLLALSFACQSAPGKDSFSFCSDFLDTLHGFECGCHEVSVVLDWGVPALGELGQEQVLVDYHFLATEGSVSLGPLEFTWLTLHFEVFVTFRTAESKHFGVIAHELDAFGRVDRPRAEVAVFNSRHNMLAPMSLCSTSSIYLMVVTQYRDFI